MIFLLKSMGVEKNRLPFKTWMGLVQLIEGLTLQKADFSLRARMAVSPFWLTKLLAHPVDFGLASFCNLMSQLLKITASLSLSTFYWSWTTLIKGCLYMPSLGTNPLKNRHQVFSEFNTLLHVPCHTLRAASRPQSCYQRWAVFCMENTLMWGVLSHTSLGFKGLIIIFPKLGLIPLAGINRIWREKTFEEWKRSGRGSHFPNPTRDPQWSLRTQYQCKWIWQLQ